MTDNELIVYRAQPLDLPKKIEHLRIPLAEVTLENRIQAGDEFYSGIFRNIEIHPEGIWGHAYLRYLAVKNPNPHSADGLFEKLASRLFGTPAKPAQTSEMKEKEYAQRWIVESGQEKLAGLGYNSKICTANSALLATLKSRAVNQSQQIISNELLKEIYTPLFDAVIQLFHHITAH